MRQLSLYQLQYRFMEGPLSSRPPMYIVSIGDLPEPVTVLQCQSQSHLPRPASVHSAKPPSHLSLSNHLLEFNLTVFFCLLTLALSFVWHFSQGDLLCVSLSRLFQRLPLILLSFEGIEAGTQFHFLCSSNLVISPRCLRVCCVTICCQICRYLAFLLGGENGVE